MSSTQHVSLWSQSPALPMLESLPNSKHKLIFIAGLSDTIATVPYLPLLANALTLLDFSLVQPQLSSSLGGYGLSSLEADAQEICLVIKHLQSGANFTTGSKIVLMGHSTGCQDVVHLLSHEREGILVNGAILQAPVSDREYFEQNNPENSSGHLKLQEAIALVEQGKGSTLLPRDIIPPRRPCEKIFQVNGPAFQEPAMTAYRFWSLNAVGGDDDYFSSDLSRERMTEIWSLAVQRGKRILAILGAEDEYYPSKVSPHDLALHWNDVVNKSIGQSDQFQAMVLAGANHKVEADEAQAALAKNISTLLQNILQKDKMQVEDYGQDMPTPSFDEVVELISTGKAESIPGVKKIPLKINDIPPSTSQMQRPAKPWETAGSNAAETIDNV